MKKLTSLGLVLGLGLVGLRLTAQSSVARARITATVDTTQMVRLSGNVDPRLRSAQDEGAAPASLALPRMLLLLKSSPQQELALQQLITDQHTVGSPQYHHWLTPQEFGQQFGVAAADVATVSQWLQSQGFTVNQVAAGGRLIEFSGTAGMVAAGLKTSLHRYVVNGVGHWANSSNPAIPAALTPVVAGVVSLNDFLKPGGRMVGQGSGVKAAGGGSNPSLTFNTGSGVAHALVPGDFATLYNVAPLYAASPAINGQGQTIAVVGRSDVNMSDISQFRTLFVPSNPGNLPTVIVNGPDPGDIGGGDEQEADLDLEWSGGVAPNATIDFVVSSSTDTTDGVDLSAEYIINQNVAAVMSTSFAACEAELGTSEDQFVESLYEQAAAQGITVVDSAGDSGAAGCDPNDGSESAAQYGLAVSGLASTPYSVGVGGTQFNEGNNSAAYWSPTSNAQTFASALGPIPETVWNESCLTSSCDSSGPLSAGGGGASILYAKPSWQATGITGMPNDGVRDVPDVSFSAAGHDGYVVCTGGSCAVNPSTHEFSFAVFGGTSASTPSFAAVMAMVDQATGVRQGQADYTLYGLAKNENWAQCNSATGAASNCIFLDTTVGNNSVPCLAGSTGCGTVSSGTLTGFSAGVGYDEATGLGSINVANLVNGWHTAAAALGSTTTLSLSPTTITHGQAVNIHVTVTQTSGAIGPTGDVSFLAQTGGSSNGLGVDFGTLTLGGSQCGTTGCLVGTENGLPGGSYPVVARYGGDGSFQPSVSNPVSVTVSPEGTVTQVVAAEIVDTQGDESAVSTANYGDPLYIDAFVQGQAAVANSSGCQAGTVACINDGIPVGTVTFLNNGSPYGPGGAPSTLALNTEGEASYPNGGSTMAPGTYSLSGTFNPSPTDPNGAASFTASTAATAPLTVVAAPTATSITNNTVNGTSLTLTAQIATNSYGLPPTGTVTFFSGTTQIGSATISGSNDPNTGIAGSAATTTTTLAPSGQDSITAQYSGDGNYVASTSAPVVISVGAVGGGFTISAATTSAAVAPGSSAAFALTLTPNNSFNGTVSMSCSGLPTGASCSFNPASLALSGGTAQSTALTIAVSSAGEVAPGGTGGDSWPWGLALAGLLALAGMLALAGRRFGRRWALPVALAITALTLAACGGGSGGGGNSGTTATVYTITVTGTSGSVTATQSLTLEIN